MKKAAVLIGLIVFIAGMAVFAHSAEKKSGAPAATDCSKAVIPDTPVAGMMGKTAWKPVVVELRKTGSMEADGMKFDTYDLEFRSEESMFAKRTASVTFLVKKGKTLDGLTFRYLPNTEIRKQPLAVDGFPEVQAWDFRDREKDQEITFVSNKGGSLKLELGNASGKTLSGKINMCVPATKDSQCVAATVSGAFQATVK
ncbi:MAG: hypothetical protein OHK006_04820 [Thermodesulfovibrionales bacterium]